ncbi:hypothetical protein FRC08_006147 [Ceratobasidium sp. 394]|nr:hypothetical protein FRC08_006147 [Ceratobasidium sp. 394]
MGAARLLVLLLAASSALVSGLVVPDSIQKPLATPETGSSLPKRYHPWDAQPSDKQADNLIFFRLATLLQHWPNTRYPNGHSVAPGTIPIGTTLYHGRNDANVPTRPEWLAFDPEHSIIFARGANSRLFTFVTTRSLHVLYFDGSSAAGMSSGVMDTQDLLIWGRVPNNTMLAEEQRILDLCEWGKEFGIDGYVRMQMSFETMYCDFARGLELVSSLHLLPAEGDGDVLSGRCPSSPTGPRIPPTPSDPGTSTSSIHFAKAPYQPKVPPPFLTGSPRHLPYFPSEPRPPSWKGALPKGEERGFEVFQAGAWHNRAPGEVRVKIDAARLVSLYDPALRSGIRPREGKEKVGSRMFCGRTLRRRAA